MSITKKRATKNYPNHPALEYLRPLLGSCRKPTTRQGKLLEALNSWFVCGEFRGFEQGLFFVQETLLEWNVELESKLGQRALEEYVSNALEGMYGDFNHSALCDSCWKEFQPVHSLTYARQVLSESALCPACTSRGGDP